MVCSHDSAIASIRVTSKRPKVIKLHGDYLYDNIKNTTSETQSLESNTRYKFMEFGKDFGLVVIGYGGRDQSVMDVLSLLLKQDDYLKNGVYWCLRKEDFISDQLMKLLWRERTFFVPIADFDEFFSELNHHLAQGEISIDTEMITARPRRLIKELINNHENSLSTSKYIENYINTLKSHLKNDMVDRVAEMSFELAKSADKATKRGIRRVPVEEKIEIWRAEARMLDKRYQEAIDLLDKLLQRQNISKYTRVEAMSKKSYCLLQTSRSSGAKNILLKLIELDKHYIPAYFNLVEIIGPQEQAFDLLESVSKMLPDDPNVDYIKGRLIYSQNDMYIDSKYSLEDAIKCLELSILKNPHYSNKAWELLIVILRQKHSVERLEECFKELRSQNQSYFLTVRMFCEFRYDLGDKFPQIEKMLNDAKDRVLPDEQYKFDTLRLEMLSKYPDFRSKVNTLIEALDRDYNDNPYYHYRKAKVLARNLGRLEEAIGACEKAVALDENYEKYQEFLFVLYLYNGQWDKAKHILDGLSLNLQNRIEFHLYQGHYDNVLLLAEEGLKDNSSDKGFIHSKELSLLHLQRWNEVVEYTNETLPQSNYSDAVSIINKSIAEKKLGLSMHSKQIQRVLETQTCNLTLAAAHCLMGDHLRALELIKKEFQINKLVKYHIRTWVVFEDLEEHSDFREIIDSGSCEAAVSIEN